MATAQMIRPETGTQTLNPFSEIKTAEWEKATTKGATVSFLDSLLVNKRLLAAAFSSILYHRKIMPTINFKTRQLEGLQFKVIYDDNTRPNNDTQIALSWINSAFEAFEKGYLRRWLISIHPREDTKKALETYIFHFKYKDGLNNMQIHNEFSRQQESIAGQNMRDKLHNILDSTIRLTESLPPISNNILVTSRFLYYDQVTPIDFEPIGFKPDPIEGSLDFIGVPVQLTLGKVDSPFHIIKLSSCINQQNISSINQTDREKWLSNNFDKDKSYVSFSNDPQLDAEKMDGNGPTQISQQIEKKSPLSLSQTDNNENNIQANCLCGRAEMDAAMLICRVCQTWQHASCYGLIMKMPECHVCYHCHDPSKGNICSDHTLLQFNNRTKALKNITLFRQCLKLAYDTHEDDVIVASEVAAKMKVEVPWVIRTFNSQPKAFIPTKLDNSIFIINRKILNEILPKYFFVQEVESGPVMISENMLSVKREPQESSTDIEIVGENRVIVEKSSEKFISHNEITNNPNSENNQKTKEHPVPQQLEEIKPQVVKERKDKNEKEVPPPKQRRLSRRSRRKLI